MITCGKCCYAQSRESQQGIYFECCFNPPQILALPGPPRIDAPNQASIQLTPVRPQMPPDGFCGRGMPDLTE